MAEYYSVARMDHIVFIHSSTGGHEGCVYLLAIMNSASMHTCAHVSESLFSSILVDT